MNFLTLFQVINVVYIFKKYFLLNTTNYIPVYSACRDNVATFGA